MDASELTLREASADDAAALLRVIREAFSARRPVDPPADALTDDVSDIEAALIAGSGVVGEIDGTLVAGLLIDIDGDLATLRRVSVIPAAARHGVAVDLVEAAVSLAADLGASQATLVVREEFPELVDWWVQRGFRVTGAEPPVIRLVRELPVVVDVPTADDMRTLGERLGGLLRKGDVIIASGDLGAGKTTMTQGLARGLGVTGPVLSPTFVISRVHPNPADGPALVHVDAYRLGGAAELGDIDLDASLADSVTLIEWGAGMAEWLSEDHLAIDIVRGIDSDVRTVYLTGAGPRWAGALEPLREQR